MANDSSNGGAVFRQQPLFFWNSSGLSELFLLYQQHPALFPCALQVLFQEFFYQVQRLAAMKSSITMSGLDEFNQLHILP